MRWKVSASSVGSRWRAFSSRTSNRLDEAGVLTVRVMGWGNSEMTLRVYGAMLNFTSPGVE